MDNEIVKRLMYSGLLAGMTTDVNCTQSEAIAILYKESITSSLGPFTATVTPNTGTCASAGIAALFNVTTSGGGAGVTGTMANMSCG